MKRFEQTGYFRLLNPFLTPLLQKLRFRDEHYLLYFSQIILSNLLCVLAAATYELLLQLMGKLALPTFVMDALTGLFQLGPFLTVFWCTWYMITLLFRALDAMRFNISWLSPRLVSCVITASLTLTIAFREGAALDHATWFYGLLVLSWAYTCLRPTLFGVDAD